MLDPKGAILIEGGNAIPRLDVVGTGLVRHFIDEGNDRLLRRPVVPGRKRVRLSNGVGVKSQRHCEKYEGGERAGQPSDFPMKDQMDPLLNDSAMKPSQTTVLIQQQPHPRRDLRYRLSNRIDLQLRVFML